ncbi:MAG: hypothetical protein AABY22_22290 [Nanoarchaeota archaeon]
MKTKTKFCIDCGKEGTSERRRCADCLTIHNNNRSKKNYSKLKREGKQGVRYGKIFCCICNEEMIKNRPNQVAHGKCKKMIVVSYNEHPRDERGMMFGRRIIIDLGLKITRKIIVHHIDENPINNSFGNLMIMSLSNHSRLHSFLREQWVINKGVYGDKLKVVWRKILIKLNYFWIQKLEIELIILDRDSLNLHEVVIDDKNIYMIKK